MRFCAASATALSSEPRSSSSATIISTTTPRHPRGEAFYTFAPSNFSSTNSELRPQILLSFFQKLHLNLLIKHRRIFDWNMVSRLLLLRQLFRYLLVYRGDHIPIFSPRRKLRATILGLLPSVRCFLLLSCDFPYQVWHDLQTQVHAFQGVRHLLRSSLYSSTCASIVALRSSSWIIHSFTEVSATLFSRSLRTAIARWLEARSSRWREASLSRLDRNLLAVSCIPSHTFAIVASLYDIFAFRASTLCCRHF